MSDIFDDVEKLLAEEVSASASAEIVEGEPVAAEETQSFNESELEDIMAEIDSLESEFAESVVEESPATEQVINLDMESVTVSKTDLQKEIEREIALIDNVVLAETADDTQDNFDEDFSELDEGDIVNTVLPFEHKTIIPSAATSKSEMSFSATGSMNLNLSFKVGSEEAKLFIDETKGLIVTISGVELSFNETSGCTVTMDNGINFNIPLTGKDSNSKKIAA